ncbi:tyrosine-type recombinase/integrase [Derxia lacustris]|uniref:tyrosine-type recombinase/integrase n=1 Tax=Derxia lacustris TaxID=764842 RepID=UPI000A172733|nr:tyrosine-type recombinase/integrase [Derxia lacustris]
MNPKPSEAAALLVSATLAPNRAPPAGKQIAADTDAEAIAAWLAEFAGSPHTLRAYRKEAVRLLVWATQARGKPLAALQRDDLLAYEAFLAAPDGDWADPTRPRTGAGRRLFAAPLSEASRRQAMNIVGGLFGWLVQAGYLAANPLALRRRTAAPRGSVRARVQERYLDQALWATVLAQVDDWPAATPRDEQHRERVRWLLRLLVGTGLRASEAAAARSDDLHRRRERWWLTVEGKGGAIGDVPVSDELMADLARYRRFHGLPPQPAPGETTPLLLPIAGRAGKPVTPTLVYLIVKEAFRRIADQLDAGDPAGAATLRRASTHWLRHTAATHQADAGNDLRHIQKNLRHASIETTAIYLHADDDRRHEQTTRPRGG